MEYIDMTEDFKEETIKENASPSNKRKAAYVIAGVLCVIVLLIAGFAIFFSCFSENQEEDINDQNHLLKENFTDRNIVDEETAIHAAKDAAVILDLGNAADELTLDNVSKTDNLIYYRLQQNYKGIPVYGCTAVVIADEAGTPKGFSNNMISVTEDIDVESSLDDAVLKQLISEYWQTTEENIYIADVERILYPMDSLKLCYLVSALKNETLYRRFIISIQDEKIVVSENALDPVECSSSDGELSFDGSKNQNEKYLLLDLENNFYCLTANGESPYRDRAWVADSVNVISSDTSRFDEKYNDVFEHHQDILMIMDYYKERFDDPGAEHFALIYQSGFLTAGGIGNTIISKELQELCGYNKNIGIIQIDAEQTGESKPNYWVLAHEYTHVITNNKVKWKAGLDFANEAQAINEAYSDLFGMIINKIENLDADAPNADTFMWDEGRDNIDISQLEKNQAYFTTVNAGTTFMWTDPKVGPVFAVQKKVGDKTYSRAYSYANAVVLEYAAYLMSQDADENGLTIEELEKLWYNTMLTLPSDCTYIVLRNNMEFTAGILDYDMAKIELISRAFDTIGVKDPNILSTEFEINAYGPKGEKHDRYSIVIEGEKKAGWFGIGGGSYSEEIPVSKEGPVSVKLPEGNYVISITDGKSTFSKHIEIKKRSSNKSLSFFVELGASKSEQMLVQEERYTSDGFLLEVIRYEYNNQGLLQGKTEWFNSDYEGAWEPTTTSYMYDRTGNLIKEYSYSDSYIGTTEYSYDANGNLLCKLIRLNGVLREKMEYTYGASGRIQSTAHSVYGDGILSFEDIEKYFYNQEGLLSHTTTTSNGEEVSNSKFSYDANGNLVKEERNSGDISMVTTYRYNDHGQLVCVNTEADYGRLLTEVYTYDENGHRVSIDSRYANYEEKTICRYDELPKSNEEVLWRKMYKEYIETTLKDAPKEAVFYVMDLDLNGIPELIINYFVYSEGMQLCTINDNQVNNYQMAGWGEILYIPQKGLICHSNGHHGIYSDTIYQLTDGKLTVIAEGSWTDPSVSGEYSWNKITVTQSEYNSQKNKAFPIDEAIPVGNVIEGKNGVMVFGPCVYSYEQIMMLLTE